MKTNPSLKIFKLSTVARLGIAIAAAVLTQAVFGDAVNLLSITETSPKSLSVTYNGSATGFVISNTSPDHWTVTVPSPISFAFEANNSLGWLEPENANLINLIQVGFPGQPSNEMQVASDVSAPADVNAADMNLYSNGATSFFTIGSDVTDPVEPADIFGAFHDNAHDSAVVPDTGSTFGLLPLSLIPLVGASRLRHFRLA